MVPFGLPFLAIATVTCTDITSICIWIRVKKYSSDILRMLPKHIIFCWSHSCHGWWSILVYFPFARSNFLTKMKIWFLVFILIIVLLLQWKEREKNVQGKTEQKRNEGCDDICLWLGIRLYDIYISPCMWNKKWGVNIDAFWNLCLWTLILYWLV